MLARRGALAWCALLLAGAARAGSYEDFFVAIQRDDPGAVQALLRRGFDPNTADAKGTPGLSVALQADALRVAALLIQTPATDVNRRNAHQETPLMFAALRGQPDMVRALLARDAEINHPGWTPLHYAASGTSNYQPEIIALLLEESAYIDAASPNGSTPLMMAAMYGSTEAVQMLLDAGADPVVKNALGLTAIDFATRVQNDAAIALIAKAIRTMRPPGSW